jgi:TPR repeat protein
MRNAKIQEYQNYLRRQALSTGRNQLGEVIELHNYFDRDMSPDMGVPGARLAREAYVDIYAHNYNDAIPLLQKAVRLGNEDAMLYLSYCYWFGHGVPQNLATAQQLLRTVGIATETAKMRNLERHMREDKEDRERSAREATLAAENAESRSASQSPSTYQSTPNKSQSVKGPLVLTPYGIKMRNSFNSGWDTSP